MELPSIDPIDFVHSKEDIQPFHDAVWSGAPSTLPCSNFYQRSFEPWEISELETFFQTTQLPIHAILLNSWTRIIDPALFVSTHLEIIRHNNGNPAFKPYFNRLLEFKVILSNIIL